MALNLDVVGSTFEPTERSWNSTDCLLYALGVGAGSISPDDELEFTTENSTDRPLRVLPTFAAVIGTGTPDRSRLGAFDPAMLLHGEQGIELFGPIPSEGTVRTTVTVAGIYDKGSGALVAWWFARVIDGMSRRPPLTGQAGSPLLFWRFSGTWEPRGDEDLDVMVTATGAGRRSVREVLPLALAVVALAAAGCGGGPSSAGSSSGSSASANSVTGSFKAPLPAGRYPSEVSEEVCNSDAPHDVALALGEKATVSRPTWVDHLYTCHYSYPNAAMTLSVKELSSWSQTLAYFHGLGTRLGTVRELKGLGQGAFQTTGGSVVVRKDWKVLLVDVSRLPASFGHPPTTPGVIGVAVADLVLGCWAGD